MMNVIQIPESRIAEFVIESGPIKILPRRSLHGWGVLPLSVLSSPHLNEEQKEDLEGFEKIEFNLSDFEVEE